MAQRDVIDRLRDVSRRISALAGVEQPAGLTEPDPDTPEERWDAAQVWAHMAEFVAYWHGQLAHVVGAYRGEPVAFGRTKTDAGRIDAIATGRHRPIAELAAETEASIGALEAYLATLDDAAWSARGLHPTRGVMDVPAMVKRFVTDHLDEHAAQLQSLAAA